MVCISSELWYEGEKVGYRCYILKEKVGRTIYTDIDIEEYEYINKKYGRLEYSVANEIGRIRRDTLHLNNQGYLCTGTELSSYSDEGLRAVESEILNIIKPELDCIAVNKEVCAELKRRYLRFNKEYFGNILPQSMKIIINSRLRTVAGRFTSYRRQPFRNHITLSSVFMEKYPEEIDNVLLHEMIHAYLNTIGFPKEHHGARFKKWMRKLNSYGFNVTVYNENSFTTTKYKYAIQCKGCGVVDKGVRKLKYDLNAYQCVVCGSRFDFIYKGLFYKAYKCDNCDEIFFEDDENAVEEQALCPYCDFELKEI